MSYTAISLQPPYYYTHHWQNPQGRQQHQQDKADWKINWRLFNEAIDRGERVYVRITGSTHKHSGSIGYVSARANPDHPWDKQDSSHIKIRWDKRKNEITEWTGTGMEWLQGYTGDTVYDYDRNRGKQAPVAPTVPLDRLGREIKVGDFCTYILHHFQYSGASIYFGTVTRLSKTGNQVYLKNIKLNDDDQVEEKRVTYSEDCVVLTKDLMDRLMMARLSVF